MQPLAPIPQEARERWIATLSNLAASRVKYPMAFARGVENEAYSKRQTKLQIGDGVEVCRYGAYDVLDLDTPDAHANAALSNYTGILRRVAWALHGSTSVTSNSFHAWLDSTDDALVDGTAHAEWERHFYAKQDLAREVLVGKDKNVRGIFACTRCKSFDVDTEQKQTRSADEPMTIFCCCNSCGSRFIR